MATQHQTSLPVRSETLRSSEGYVTDEEPISDVAPSDSAGLLLERLRAWKHCCADLEAYVKATEKTLKDHSKDYSKVMKSISGPLREGHHFDPALGGMTGLFENIRTNTQAISNSYLETSQNLDNQVLPVLERIHKEIKEKSKELSHGAGKAAKAVDSARNETQKRIDLLGQSTASYGSAGGKIDASSDPYVVGRGIHHMLNRQIVEENNSRQDVIAVQKNFQQFEAHILAHLQQAFGQLLILTGSRAEKEKALYSDISSNAQSIAPDFEWNKFVQRNGDLMVDPNAGPRSLSNITWPNMDHPSTKPLISGNLERKGRGVGALTGYKTGFYVVTASKFLHQFESDDDLEHDPTPELSLFLPDCTVGSVSDNKFNVKGKDVSKGKIGQAFQMSHEVAFKASSAAEAQRWREIIASVATSTEDVPIDDAVASPVSAEDRLPPPNTDVPMKQVLDERAVGGVPATATHPATGHVPVGQTSGAATHAVLTPAAPTTATTTSPGAGVLGK